MHFMHVKDIKEIEAVRQRPPSPLSPFRFLLLHTSHMPLVLSTQTSKMLTPVLLHRQGRVTEKLQRKHPLTRKYLADDQKCFSIFGYRAADNGEHRSQRFAKRKEAFNLDLSANTHVDQQKWVNAINHLIAWNRKQKPFGL